MRLLSLAFACLYACTAFAAWAQAESGDTYHRCAPDGVAVGGYDLVSYFSASGPVPGVDTHELERNGFVYRFASAQNLQAFASDPERYLPRYQGWCATTLAMGRLTCPDPLNFMIEDGSLLLFELVGFTNGRTVWEVDPQSFRKRADDNARLLLN